MVNPFNIASGIANGVLPGAGLVVDNYGKSHQNNQRDTDLKNDAASAWQGDRQIIENEWGQLDPQYHQPAPPSVTAPEAFETWSHQQIWDALNGHDGVPGVSQSDINAGADGWRRLTSQATQAVDAFRNGIDEDITNLWAGKAANAAMESTRTYTDEFRKLTVSFQMVANGIDLMQGYLDQTKLSIAPPEKVNAVGEFMGHVPGNGVLKLSKHRANEAGAHAQEVMTTFYQPGVQQVDGRTPLLPEPYNPPGNKPVVPGTPSPSPGTTNPAGTPSPGATNPAGPNAPGQNETQQPGDPGNTAPQSVPTTPQNTNPASTTPQNYLQDPVGRPNSPSPNTPGSPSLSTPGLPGTTPSTPNPGRSIPGKPTGPTTPTGTPAAARSTAGRAGMPGMGMPGAGRGNNKDDEDEHTSPDYLIQDRTTELLGVQPRVLPPGGVIGA